MLKYVSPLVPQGGTKLSTEHGPTRRLWLRLGTRVGLVTASNDHQALRLTGLLSLARSSLAGSGFHAFLLFIKSGFRVFSVLHWSWFDHAADGPDKAGQFAAQGCGGHL